MARLPWAGPHKCVPPSGASLPYCSAVYDSVFYFSFPHTLHGQVLEKNFSVEELSILILFLISSFIALRSFAKPLLNSGPLMCLYVL